MPTLHCQPRNSTPDYRTTSTSELKYEALAGSSTASGLDAGCSTLHYALQTVPVVLFASGTVYGDILIWCVHSHCQPNSNSMERAILDVPLTLKGHHGSIFQLHWSPRASYDLVSSRVLLQLCSVSDDRSVRCWNICIDFRSIERHQYSFEQTHCMFGHTARVWDCSFIDHYATEQGSSLLIASCGEDATCRLWDASEECVVSLEGHRGRHIWCLVFNQTMNTLITGGGDGALMLWSIKAALQNRLGLSPQSYNLRSSPVPNDEVLQVRQVGCPERQLSQLVHAHGEPA